MIAFFVLHIKVIRVAALRMLQLWNATSASMLIRQIDNTVLVFFVTVVDLHQYSRHKKIAAFL
jgi:hypothetical protein